ncbi:MAG: hypothetical protein M1821_007210 [Bathelium mastoideum]|nr:MAG: hypothetical protein M1821_007210 [Bathelium mastoideum]KAI9694716.1 MAG: hypothetical protein M1822_000332 [Bathelium mastoideum]
MSQYPKFPKSFGVLYYPAFEVLDIAGPLEALNVLSRMKGFEDMELSIISKTLDPVSVGPIAPNTTSQNFAGRQRYLPTHTFADAPPLDVLIIPGGAGSADPSPGGGKPDIQGYIDFARKAYNGLDGRRPLKYLITVCNGTIVAAKAGILDGHKATTNKDGWDDITPLGPRTHWIAKARWISSGNIWTTSGVSAGTDGVLAWMDSMLPDEIATKVAVNIEWIRAQSADDDPFAEIEGCKDVLPKEK